MGNIKNEGSELLESLFDVAETRVRLTALKTANKGAHLASSLFSVVIVSLVFIFSMVLFSIAFAVLISDALDKPASGYFIIAGLYFFIGILLLITRREIIFGPLLKIIVSEL